MVLFFNGAATTEIYTLSLHDALPISYIGSACCITAGRRRPANDRRGGCFGRGAFLAHKVHQADRKSTRLNSSHANISYAVFCLKKQPHPPPSTPPPPPLSLYLPRHPP